MESMNTRDAKSQMPPWQGLPLCRRYTAGVFSTVYTRVRCADGAFDQAVHWALGSLADGDCEVLGVWGQIGTGSALPADMFADLEARGVESIRFVIGGNWAGAGGLPQAVTLAGMTTVPSIEQALSAILTRVVPRDRNTVACALRAVAAAGSRKAVDAAMIAFERGRWGASHPQIVAQWRLALAQWAPLFALSASLRRVVLSGDHMADSLQASLVRAIGRHGCFASHAEVLNFVADTLLRAERRLVRVRTEATTESRPYRAGSSSRPPASGFLSL